MEVRRKENDGSIPNSFCYNQAHQLNQESSSSKLSSVSATVIPTERINEAGLLDPTLDQSHDGHLPHHHRHSNPRVPERDPNPDPLPPPPQPQPQPATISEATNRAPWIRYRECLKNHAATMGSHVVDGCGEFMSGGDEGTPEALKCAACDCHRNFHRKEVEGEPQTAPNSFYTYNPNPNINNSSRTKIHPTQVPPPLPPPPPPPPNHHHNIYAHGHHHHHAFSTSPPVMLGFGGNRRAPAESSSEDLPPPSLSGSKKRFRTKFTQEQKDRMQEFGEKLGWKIQKQDEQEVQQFCAEVGVTRQVFKVWMHNNKQAMKKKHL